MESNIPHKINYKTAVTIILIFDGDCFLSFTESVLAKLYRFFIFFYLVSIIRLLTGAVKRGQVSFLYTIPTSFHQYKRAEINFPCQSTRISSFVTQKCIQRADESFQ